MTAWYEYPRVDNYAIFPDPFGNFPKPDSNINAPAGTPITALASGVISGINSPSGVNPDFGQVVTIKLDTPINPIATHEAYLHLASLAPVSIGQRVNAGDVVGYAGSNSQNAGTGFALYNGDFYGYGASWARYVGSAFLNPVPVLNAVKSNNIPGASSQLVSGTSGGTSLTGDVASSILAPFIGPIETSISAGLSTTMLLLVGLLAIIMGLFILIGNTELGKRVAETAVKAATL